MPVWQCILPDIRSTEGKSTTMSLDNLTHKERIVASLVGRGLSNKGIARQLGLAEGTVKIHLHHIYQKLGTQNRVLLALRIMPTANEIAL
jgi:two-component system, NarL family, nitrate/nitrite response regulator NarL